MVKPELLEQYKLAVEMADRISARRGIANSFYFTVSSALLAASESLGLSLAAGAGLVLAGAWWLQLQSYRTLNAAKWQVIGELEAQLPARPFGDEWTILKNDPFERVARRWKSLDRLIRPLARYAELSVVEQVVPAVFVFLFGTVILKSL
jgi:hypothetical protein